MQRSTHTFSLSCKLVKAIIKDGSWNAAHAAVDLASGYPVEDLQATCSGKSQLATLQQLFRHPGQQLACMYLMLSHAWINNLTHVKNLVIFPARQQDLSSVVELGAQKAPAKLQIWQV